MRRFLFSAGSLTVAALLLGGCTNTADTDPGDPTVKVANPSALGTGNTNAQLNDPTSPDVPVNNQMVTVTGSSFLWKDEYAETPSASSVGSVYVEDFTASDAGGLPYSGMLLFKSVYVPASLQLSPGDVIDFTGQYNDYAGPSTFLFPTGQTEPEMNEPIVTFRFDYTPPAPAQVPVTDLQDSFTLAGFQKGYKWISMLVTVQNLTTPGPPSQDGSGRISVFLTSDTSTQAIALDNELMALDPTQFPMNTKLKSVTGIVTYFDAFHIAPRTPADIVFENPPPQGDAGADAQ